MTRHLATLIGLCALGATACFETLDTGAVGVLPCDFGAVCPPPADGSVPTLTTTPAILLADGGTSDDPCVKNQGDALNLRRRFCAGCHQEPAHLGTTAFGFVLEDDKLMANLSSSGIPYVTAGNPARSRLYQRVANQEMPPPPGDISPVKPPTPTVSDVSVLYQWIMCLGPAAGAGDARDPGAGDAR